MRLEDKTFRGQDVPNVIPPLEETSTGKNIPTHIVTKRPHIWGRSGRPQYQHFCDILSLTEVMYYKFLGFTMILPSTIVKGK
jgi:hypothetical protein